MESGCSNPAASAAPHSCRRAQLGVARGVAARAASEQHQHALHRGTLSSRPSFSANSCWLLEQLQMESILQRAPRCLQIFAAKISKQGRGSKGEGEGARECKEGEEKDNDLLRGCWFITTFFGLSQLCTGI